VSRPHPSGHSGPAPVPGEREVPDIGDLFEHDGSVYRVDGWVRPAAPPEPAWHERGTFAEELDRLVFETLREHGPDRRRLEFCARKDAEYVVGYGVAGVIVRVAGVRVSGRVPWPPETVERQRRLALALVGRPVS
jgi:hypothetical protein